jgi:leucyl/phenylalanyl-tRNA--protein transferase
VEYLKKRGSTWIDIQNISPLFALFGAREITRADFMAQLRGAIHLSENVF